MQPVALLKTSRKSIGGHFQRLAVLLPALLLATITCHGDEAPAEKKPGTPGQAKEGWKELFDGKTLKGWTVSEFGGQGEVNVEEGHITLGLADGCTGVTLKGDFPKIDYEVSIEAMRVEGNDFFCGMTFPVADSPCSLIVGGWGGTVVGLSSIDGQDAANNQTTTTMRFEKGRWYKIRVRVTAKKIEAWIDDKQMVDQSLMGHKLSIRSEVEPSKPFGIASWCTTAALRNIKWRPLETKKEN